MDLRKIENLIHVADAGSFSKAASVLGIAQSALGRQVRKLEDECGCALLYRNGRGVSLTPEGEKLLDRLRPLLAQMTRVVSEFHDEQNSPSGQVTLGLTPTLCHMVGMPLVAEVWKRHPRIQLNVITGYSGYVHEWLANARVDIAVLHDARRSQHIVVDPLAELDLVLVSPAQSLAPAARAQAAIDFAQLRGLPLALPTRNHGLRRTLEHAAAQADLPLNVAFEMDALELMKEIVLRAGPHRAGRARRGARTAGGQLVARRIVNPGLSTPPDAGHRVQPSADPGGEDRAGHPARTAGSACFVGALSGVYADGGCAGRRGLAGYAVARYSSVPSSAGSRIGRDSSGNANLTGAWEVSETASNGKIYPAKRVILPVFPVFCRPRNTGGRPCRSPALRAAPAAAARASAALSARRAARAGAAAATAPG